MTSICSAVRFPLGASPFLVNAPSMLAAVFETDARVVSLSIDQLSGQTSPYSLVGATPGPSPDQSVVPESLAGKALPLDREERAAKAIWATARAAFLANVKKPLQAVEDIKEIILADPSRGVADAARSRLQIVTIESMFPQLTIEQAIEIHDEARKLVRELRGLLPVQSKDATDQLMKEIVYLVATRKLAG